VGKSNENIFSDTIQQKLNVGLFLSRGHLTPQCNAAAFIDVSILGERHMYQYPTCKKLDPPCPYFDPEGLV
jgi:hypothetical protein